MVAELASQSVEAVQVSGLKIRGWCLPLANATESFGAGKVVSLKNGYEKLQQYEFESRSCPTKQLGKPG